MINFVKTLDETMESTLNFSTLTMNDVTVSRKAVTRSPVKDCWSLEPDKDKNKNFGENNHDNNPYPLWSLYAHLSVWVFQESVLQWN